MEKPEHVQCKNCIYWEGYGDRDYGVCHRHPPSPSHTPQRLIEGIAAIFSQISGIALEDDAIQSFLEPGYVHEYSDASNPGSDHWCGEFRSEWPAS